MKQQSVVNLGTIRMAYDRRGRLWYIEGKKGNRVYRVYDEKDMLVGMVTQSGRMTETLHDPYGKVRESIHYSQPVNEQQMKILRMGFNSNIAALRPPLSAHDQRVLSASTSDMNELV